MNQKKHELRLKQIRNVAVYCGSHDVSDPAFNAAVVVFGQFLAAHKMALVFGGSNVGTMKLLADTVLENGGRVVGIFTKNLPEKLLHPGLTETFVAANLAERKAEMLQRADVVVALPGSYGTWDELFDALALRKISSGGHQLPVGVLNVNGYFDDLLKFIRHSVEVGFTAPKYAGLLKSGKTPDELFAQLAGVLNCTVSLIPAVLSDAAELCAMQQKAFAALLAKYHDDAANPGAENTDKITERLMRPEVSYFFIRQGKHKTGALRVTDKGNGVRRLSTMFILPEFQKMGIARKVFPVLETHFPDTLSWELDTIAEEEHLVKLYESVGYRATGERKNIASGQTLVFYEKRMTHRDLLG